MYDNEDRICLFSKNTTTLGRLDKKDFCRFAKGPLYFRTHQNNRRESENCCKNIHNRRVFPANFCYIFTSRNNRSYRRLHTVTNSVSFILAIRMKARKFIRHLVIIHSSVPCVRPHPTCVPDSAHQSNVVIRFRLIAIFISNSHTHVSHQVSRTQTHERVQ